MREKLIELLRKSEELADKRCDFAENCDKCPANNQGIDCLEWLLADCMIANGVTIPVRCKDCAVPHNRFTGCPNLDGLIPPQDFFCAYGERKTDE